jgi:hypothetical protein
VRRSSSDSSMRFIAEMQVLTVTTGGPRYMLGARYKF